MRAISPQLAHVRGTTLETGNGTLLVEEVRFGADDGPDEFAERRPQRDAHRPTAGHQVELDALRRVAKVDAERHQSRGAGRQRGQSRKVVHRRAWCEIL